LHGRRCCGGAARRHAGALDSRVERAGSAQVFAPSGVYSTSNVRHQDLHHFHEDDHDGRDQDGRGAWQERDGPKRSAPMAGAAVGGANGRTLVGERRDAFPPLA
jgi:hypothetical protein